jgi:hypothetical protein
MAKNTHEKQPKNESWQCTRPNSSHAQPQAQPRTLSADESALIGRVLRDGDWLLQRLARR